jgi:hypothetical protein
MISFFTMLVNAPAFYLDPGSGSFILQILIATLVGSLFLIKTYWKKITTFFHERFSKDRDQSDQ